MSHTRAFKDAVQVFTDIIIALSKINKENDWFKTDVCFQGYMTKLLAQLCSNVGLTSKVSHRVELEAKSSSKTSLLGHKRSD